MNYRDLPNLLSVIRVGCIPLVLLLLSFPGKWGSLGAALAFALASLTDTLDGFLARRFGSVTNLGKLLDPLADKILISSTMILLIPLGRIPSWVVILIVAREIAVTGLRAIAMEQGKVIQASTLGKTKTVLQSMACLFLCAHYPLGGMDMHFLGMLTLWPALAVTMWSGWDYFRLCARYLLPEPKETETPGEP